MRELLPIQSSSRQHRFEAVRAHGKDTAYTDKHPAYDMVRGHNVTGLSTGFFPKNAAVSVILASVIAYDAYRQPSRQRNPTAILNLYAGAEITAAGLGNWTLERLDPAVPDMIIQPQLGVVYTTSKKKIAEHGGLNDDDRHVACFVSNPRLKKQQVSGRVETTQVAPFDFEGARAGPEGIAGCAADGRASAAEVSELMHEEERLSQMMRRASHSVNVVWFQCNKWRLFGYHSKSI